MKQPKGFTDRIKQILMQDYLLNWSYNVFMFYFFFSVLMFV